MVYFLIIYIFNRKAHKDKQLDKKDAKLESVKEFIHLMNFINKLKKLDILCHQWKKDFVKEIQ